MEYKNILIEIDDKDLSFDNPLKVFIDHQHVLPIGHANLTLKSDGLYADFALNISKLKGKYYPSIMYTLRGKSGKIFGIALHNGINVDNRIKALVI